MRVTATEAKNRFGSLCAQAKREPVFVEKAGQLDTVILSAEHYQALQAPHDKADRAARKKPLRPNSATGSLRRTPVPSPKASPAPTCAPGEAPVAQYDVFPNPSTSAAHGIPFVVVVQSELLDALATRLTLPLAVPDATARVPTVLCPVILVNGQRLHALAHYAAPLPARLLRRPVDNVAAQAGALVAALDAVLSGI